MIFDMVHMGRIAFVLPMMSRTPDFVILKVMLEGRPLAEPLCTAPLRPAPFPPRSGGPASPRLASLCTNSPRPAQTCLAQPAVPCAAPPRSWDVLALDSEVTKEVPNIVFRKLFQKDIYPLSRESEKEVGP